MANKRSQANNTGMSLRNKILLALFAFLMLAFLLIAGFAVGAYLRLFDMNELNEEYALYDKPIIGSYFVRPPGADESEADEESSTVEDAKTLTKEAVEAKKTEKKESGSIKVSKEELEKQIKERQAAEKKRISKLARLYNEMKPADAAAILSDLDDDMAIAILSKMDESQVSQILASQEFGADNAARITRIMYTGVKGTGSADAAKAAAKEKTDADSGDKDADNANNT